MILFLAELLVPLPLLWSPLYLFIYQHDAPGSVLMYNNEDDHNSILLLDYCITLVMILVKRFKNDVALL